MGRRSWPRHPKPKPPALTAYDRAVLRLLKNGGEKLADEIPTDTRDRLFMGYHIHYRAGPSPNPNHYGAWVDFVHISETGKIELQLEDMRAAAAP